MPVHDWTRVEAGIFHAFHTTWISEIQNALNEDLLPGDFYALAEQHAGNYIADILTLHAAPESDPNAPLPPLPPETGGVAVAEAPPQVSRRQVIEQQEEQYTERRRSIAIRHVSGHRLVALLEIVSPGNKDRAQHVEDFATKAADALGHDVHLLLIDLFPPSRFDPNGMHHEIARRFGEPEQPYDLPPDKPLTLASYAAQGKIEIYLEHLAAGANLTAMPLFFRPDRYVNVPLEATYQQAYRGMPAFWRNVLEGNP